jgi:hypothetical protein
VAWLANTLGAFGAGCARATSCCRARRTRWWPSRPATCSAPSSPTSAR